MHLLWPKLLEFTHKNVVRRYEPRTRTEGANEEHGTKVRTMKSEHYGSVTQNPGHTKPYRKTTPNWVNSNTPLWAAASSDSVHSHSQHSQS